MGNPISEIQTNQISCQNDYRSLYYFFKHTKKVNKHNKNNNKHSSDSDQQYNCSLSHYKLDCNSLASNEKWNDSPNTIQVIQTIQVYRLQTKST